MTLDGQHSEGLVIGLHPNTPYYFAVYVWNEAGNGPKSEHFQQRTLRNGEPFTLFTQTCYIWTEGLSCIEMLHVWT